MIETWHVRDALRPRLGSALVDEPGFLDGITHTLRSFAPYKDTFASMAARLEEDLFNLLYERLGPGMSVTMDGGRTRRVRTAELKDAADDVMGVLFDSLKVYSVNYDILHDYCMETGSFSALRVLYTKYQVFLPEGERRIIARIIRDNYPASAWENWLSPADL